MNNFKNFIEENKDQLNSFAKEYIEKLEMPDILKESITYSLVNDGKKIRPLSFLYWRIEYGIRCRELRAGPLQERLLPLFCAGQEEQTKTRIFFAKKAKPCRLFLFPWP